MRQTERPSDFILYVKTLRSENIQGLASVGLLNGFEDIFYTLWQIISLIL